jgi:hypothetical protein
MRRVVALTALLVTACAPAPPAAPGTSAPAERDAAVAAAPQRSDPAPPPTALASPDVTATPRACEPAVADDVDTVVTAQLDAFARDDIAGAFRVATESFKREQRLDGFERLVADNFPPVRDPAGHTVEACQTDGRRAALDVVVTARSGERGSYTYVLDWYRGQWRIAQVRPTRA